MQLEVKRTGLGYIYITAGSDKKMLPAADFKRCSLLLLDCRLVDIGCLEFNDATDSATFGAGTQSFCRD